MPLHGVRLSGRVDRKARFSWDAGESRIALRGRRGSVAGWRPGMFCAQPGGLRGRFRTPGRGKAARERIGWECDQKTLERRYVHKTMV